MTDTEWRKALGRIQARLTRPNPYAPVEVSAGTRRREERQIGMVSFTLPQSDVDRIDRAHNGAGRAHWVRALVKSALDVLDRSKP